MKLARRALLLGSMMMFLLAGLKPLRAWLHHGVPASLPSGVTLQAIDGETLTGNVQSNNYFSRSKGGFNDSFTFATSNSSYPGFSWDDTSFFPIVSFNGPNNSGDNTLMTGQLNMRVGIGVGGVFGGGNSSSMPSAGIQDINAGNPIGAWTPGLHVDEPADAGVSAISGTAAAIQNNRFWEIVYTWQLLNGGNQNGVTTNQILTPNFFASPGGHRSVDIMGADWYFFCGSTGQSQSQMSSALAVSVSADQAARGCHYGNMIDYWRAASAGFSQAVQFLPTGTQPTAKTIFSSYPENWNGYVTGPPVARSITPQEYNWALWSAIIHGARMISPFLAITPTGGAPAGLPGNSQGFDNTVVVGGITIFNQAVITHGAITNLARVISSPFALSYCNVSPLGYQFPVYQSNWFNGGFEIAVHWYQGGTYTPTSGPLNGTAISNGFYIFADTRYGQTGYTTQTATFTLVGTAAEFSGHAKIIYSTDGDTGTVKSISSGVFTDTFANAWSVKVYQITT